MKTAAIMAILRQITFGRKHTLYRLDAPYYFVPHSLLAQLVNGEQIQITGKGGESGVLMPDGGMTIFDPFHWDGCSPRFSVRLGKLRLFSVGTPNGPRVKGSKNMRAGTRASLRHDFLCRYASAIARETGRPEQEIIDIADLIFQDDITTDWSERVGEIYYRAVRMMGAAYRGDE
jgi:hypothetical protein